MIFDIRNIDCLSDKGIDSFPDNHFDIAIIDPPYGIDYQSSRRTDKDKRHKKIENDKEPFTKWLKPLYPKMKEGGRLFIFYRWDVMDSFVYSARDAGFKPIWDMVWDKMRHGMGDLKAAPGPQHEPFMYFTKGRYEFKGRRPVTVYRIPAVPPEKMIHSNEKPSILYEAIIRDFASEGEKMVDLFLGSGASGTAAKRVGLDFYGYEIDKEYFEKAKQRQKLAIQKSLF